MAKVDVDCYMCQGEGELKDMFQELRTCPNCRGAGVVMISARKFVKPIREVGLVTTRKIEKSVDNDKDKIVLIVFKEREDVQHIFCGTEENANEYREQREKNGFYVEQYTPNEYYKVFNSVYKPKYNMSK